jgi:hypothetical protein
MKQNLCFSLNWGWVHAETERTWTRNYCMKHTLVVLRDPVDRFASAYRYAFAGTVEDANGGRHLRAEIQRFPTVESFVQALMVNDTVARHVIQRREDGIQFRSMKAWLDGDPTRRLHVCYSPNLALGIETQLKRVNVSCDFSHVRRFWTSRDTNTSLSDASALFLYNMYAWDKQLFDLHCGAPRVRVPLHTK